MESLTQHPRVAILVPCYKRYEYTLKCIQALSFAQDYINTTFYLVDDASDDGTFEILSSWKGSNIKVVRNFENEGLRSVIINFLEICQFEKYDFIGKIDNDCGVPKNWLNDILAAFKLCPEVEVLSPNVHPSNAAFIHGKKVEGLRYMPAKLVGGLWFMRGSLIYGLDFQEYDTDGLTGAIALLNQIVTEKEPIIGWLPDVIVEDMGHWSGSHPDHIKSKEHAEYSKVVGRDVSWSA